MATLALHVAVGLLLGLALRLSLRRLAFAPLLAALPDLDHLWPMVPRVTFHNALFVAVLPTALALAVWAWPRRAPHEGPLLRRLRGEMPLLTAAPALLSSEVVLDLLPFEVSGNRVAMLWPFDPRPYVLPPMTGIAVDPTSTSTFVLALLLLLGLVAGCLALRWLTAAPPAARARVLGTAAVALALAAFLPVTALAGPLTLAPSHPEARLAWDAEPTPDGGLALHVEHLGGEVVPVGALRAELRDAAGATLAKVSNDAPLLLGRAWDALLPSAPGAVVRLVAARDGFAYAPSPDGVVGAGGAPLVATSA